MPDMNDPSPFRGPDEDHPLTRGMVQQAADVQVRLSRRSPYGRVVPGAEAVYVIVKPQHFPEAIALFPGATPARPDSPAWGFDVPYRPPGSSQPSP